ncbi:RusA family crossover junction endodeoxyribonuclease [Methylorubrum extorquens]|uniref:RusA family crossover junction endodeoxyribonuclease n=1 Tax=Methylorubrum extorquens TaxID=408 RepID=A0AAX3WPY0_METEX|nr:RusA family crossover junction endodeoxyribonuclease [Methylorubrum extorquens]WHQ72551.1 RusA family crossover junction endodeoxyribonuclease [Methylorubrum extorquens]
MYDSVTIRLPGAPRGKGRHRAQLVQRAGQKPRIHSHPDQKTEIYEGALRVAAGLAMRGRPLLTGPLDCTIFAFFPIPKSWSKAKREAAIAHSLRPGVKPDWDNIAKVTDALNTVVWADDAAVVDGLVRKFYATKPELVIVVKSLDPQAARLPL